MRIDKYLKVTRIIKRRTVAKDIVNADRIYVMENGEIIESGSHDELMKMNGTYAYMFNLQAEKYKK